MPTPENPELSSSPMAIQTKLEEAEADKVRLIRVLGQVKKILRCREGQTLKSRAEQVMALIDSKGWRLP